MARCQVNFRCTLEDRDRLRAACAARDKTLGGFVVESLEWAHRRPEVFSFEELAHCVRFLAHSRPMAGPLWHSVALAFGVGSSTAELACIALGFDPDSGREISREESRADGG